MRLETIGMPLKHGAFFLFLLISTAGQENFAIIKTKAETAKRKLNVNTIQIPVKSITMSVKPQGSKNTR